jgi:hypothetical protein
MNRVFVIDNHRHSTFELQQLLKKKPIQIANRLVSIFGNEVEQVVKKNLFDSIQKEEFMHVLRAVKKEKEIRRWNKSLV